MDHYVIAQRRRAECWPRCARRRCPDDERPHELRPRAHCVDHDRVSARVTGPRRQAARKNDGPLSARRRGRRRRARLARARSANALVVHAGYHFTPGYPELGTPDHGMDAAIVQSGTFVGRGAEPADGFAPAPGELVVSGRTGVSAFAGSTWIRCCVDGESRPSFSPASRCKPVSSRLRAMAKISATASWS